MTTTSPKPKPKLLTDAELAAARYNLEQGKASLACEGITLTEEENTLFRGFEDARLSHEERRRRIVEFCRAKGGQHTVPAVAE